MPRALIVGHTGQDGRILWHQLALRGYVLTGLSRSGLCRGDGSMGPPVDLADAGAVTALLYGVKPDEVYFLAARHHSSQEAEVDPLLAWHDSLALHVQAFLHVLQGVVEACPAAGVFYASSSRVFGRAERSPQNETTPLQPDCVYGVTKAAGMLVAQQYRSSHGLRVCCGIMFNHESPIRGAEYVSQRVVRGLVAIQRGMSGPISIGDLDARVDWGYAPDYTRAMQAMLAADVARDYVVATGVTHSVRDLVEHVAGRLGLDWRECVTESAGLLRRPPQGLCGDASLLRQSTGWAPSQDFRGMLDLMVDAALAVPTGQ